MKVLKYSIAALIAIGLYGVGAIFIYGLAKLTNSWDRQGLAFYFVMLGGSFVPVLFFVFLEDASKHVPYLRRFMEWLDPRED